MTDAAETTEAPIPEAGSALVLAVNENPSIVLLDTARFDRFFVAVKEETAKLVPDLSTTKGRDEIRSMAMKVTKTKTAIDAAGKLLKEDAQKTVKTVDAARRQIWDKLEAHAIEVRAPLTEWEEREKVRIAKADGIIQGLRDDAVVTTTETAEDVSARLVRLTVAELDSGVLGDRFEMATELRETALTALREALARIRQEEADRAELDRLRAAEAERERIKAEKQAAYEVAKAAQREAAAKEEARLAYVDQIMKHITHCGLGLIGGAAYPYAILIRELEEKVVLDDKLAPDWEKIDKHRLETLERLREAMQKDQERAQAEAEQAEALRIETAKREAAEEAERRARAAAEAERNAEAERHRLALAAEKRRADEAEEAAQKEADAAKAKAAADAARAADQAHRSRIMGGAKEALIALGVEAGLARTVVLAIAAGEVPAVSIAF